MARLLSIEGHDATRIDNGWLLASTQASAIATPNELPSTLKWIAATVPGTVASARAAAGTWNAGTPAPLHGEDHWYRTSFQGLGKRTLRFHGLATLATVWLDGVEILSSRSMFVSHDIAVDLKGDNELVICFRSLDRKLSEASAAGRWRPRMITPSSLRHVRTTLLGHMPGWCPQIDVAGPWRAIECIDPEAADITCDVHAYLVGTTGLVEVSVDGVGWSGSARIECANRSADLTADSSGILRTRLEIPDVEAWWPHTHGTPALHQVDLFVSGRRISLGRVGFRSIEVDKGADGRGFGLVVNGVPIFCRGAVWSSADVADLPESRDALEPWLQRAKEAGMNMLRVPGTAIYEADAFYDLCDELGLLVWQDFMFANFDYPASDPAFLADVEMEARQFLSRTQTSACLCVLSGGSEVYQQAAMLGLPERKYNNPIFDEILPRLIADARPDVAYVVNSPSGGALPFSVDSGVAHYFGVGGYKRPLGDERRANVRFASECLAFANVPSQVAMRNGALAQCVPGDAAWKALVPRDIGASWDFEDVRDHYVEEIFGVQAAALRYLDSDRYLEFGRAASAHAMEHVFGEWLRPGSPTRGGLVLMLQDLQQGAGWGLIDAAGEPKSPWHALKRLFTPIRVTISDEGMNGLDLHVSNETGAPRALALRLVALRDGRTVVLNKKRDIDLGAREDVTINAYDLLGSFFDLSYAYRFQPPQHDTTVALLMDRATGEVLSEAFHFPGGHADMAEAEVSATVERQDETWWLTLAAAKTARFVHYVDMAFRAEDDWFHLSPLRPRRVRLIPRGSSDDRPDGRILALNLNSNVTCLAKE